MEDYKNDIESALKVLRSGGVILYPTDTVWGLGCDAENSKAVDKIYKIKNRNDAKSMLILVDSPDRIYNYVNKVPQIATDIIEVTDKPVTIIYPDAVNLPENLLADDYSVGIRVTSDEFCKRLIKKFNKAIVSTSANFSGIPAPQNFSEINADIVNAVDYTVKYKQNDKTKNKPSSIIKIGIKGEVKIIRK